MIQPAYVLALQSTDLLPDFFGDIFTIILFCLVSVVWWHTARPAFLSGSRAGMVTGLCLTLVGIVVLIKGFTGQWFAYEFITSILKLPFKLVGL